MAEDLHDRPLAHAGPGDCDCLFLAGNIALEIRGLAEMLAAVAEYHDAANHHPDLNAALFLVERALRALVPRIERFENPDIKPSDYYEAEIGLTADEAAS